MKKLLAMATITLILGGLSVSTYAQTNGYGQGVGRIDTVNVNDYSTDVWERFTRNYEFNSGVDYKTELGRPTNTNIVPRDFTTENVRRNKDTAYNAPSYGVFSGDIDTERSNPFYSPKNYANARDTTDYSVNSAVKTLQNGGLPNNYNVGNSTGLLPSTSTMATNTTANSAQNTTTNAPSPTVSYYPTPTNTTTQNELNTQPWLYEDGTIGTLKIPRFNVNVKIYEGESLDNLKKGLAHFSFTSAYDGNVGIAGHNDKALCDLFAYKHYSTRLNLVGVSPYSAKKAGLI